MKSHKKLVALIVALTFVLSLAVPMTAGAATVEDNSAAKVKALGIMTGYPDGTMGLDKSITRAEFAKVAVIAAGMESAADLLKNTPSQFSDVKTGEWYTGWINLAAAQGFVKGDPAGTFRPNDKISYAEVITVLMRILGYNDNLPGEWPIDYIVKANDLDLLDNVSFDAKAPATRGAVAVMVAAVLDAERVKYDKDSNEFVGQTETLIAKSFKGAIQEDKVVVDFEYKDGIFKMVVLDKDAAGKTKTVEVKSDATLVGADNVTNLTEKVVDYITDKKGKALYVEVKPYTVITKNPSSSYKVAITSSTVTVDPGKSSEKKYDFADNAFVNLDGTIVAPSTADVTSGQVLIVLNEDGDVMYVEKNTYDKPAVVKEYKAAKKTILVKSDVAHDQTIPTDLNDDDKEYLFVKDGKIADLSELKEDDLLWNFGNVKGADYYLVAKSTKVTGTLESTTIDNTKVTVNGKEYTLNNAALSTDAGDTFDAVDASTDFSDIFDETVTLSLDMYGKVRLIVSDIEGASAAKNYGIVVKAKYDVATADGVKPYVRITKSDGTRIGYAVSSDFNHAKGTFLEYTLKSDGSIDTATPITVTGNVYDVDTKTNRIKIGSNWFVVDSNVVVFKYDGSATKEADIVKIIPYSDVASHVDGLGSGESLAIAYKASNNLVKYIVVADSLATADKYAMVVGKGVNADGNYVKLNIAGEVKTYTYKASGLPALSGLNNGDFVSYSLSGNEVAELTVVKAYNASDATTEVADVSGSTIKLDNSYYVIDSDTVIYDATTADKPVYVSGVSEGDDVWFSADDDGVLKWVIIR